MTSVSRARALLMALGATVCVACDWSSALDTAATNDLRGPVNAPTPNGPAPGPTVNIARGGVADDGVKPVVNAGKVGTADDGVKPVVNAGKVGTADDGVKPVSANGTKVGEAKGPGSPAKPLLPKPATSAR